MAKSTVRKWKHRHTGSTRFLGKSLYQSDNNIPATIEHIQFDNDNYTTKDVSGTNGLRELIKDDKINWFNIKGLSDSQRIAHIFKEFGLHGFDVKDMLSEQKIVKVVLYDDVTFILMSVFSIDKDSMLNEAQIALIVGSNYIVTMQPTANTLFDELKTIIAHNDVSVRQKGTDFFLYLVLNAVNNVNTMASMSMEDELADIEDRLIDRQMSTDILHFLRMRRIDYTHMRRFVLAFREEYNNLLHNTNGIIMDANVVYFNDYDDRLRTTLGNLEGFREGLFSLLDLYYNNNNLIMNDIIKRLTIVSTIFIPLTFMVGVWGMNFEFMPETKWQHGYLFAWLTLIAIAVLAGIFLKKKKWF